MAAQIIPEIPGATVKLNVVERQFGRLEAGIKADSRGHLSDVCIPAIQKACEVAGLRLLRSPGYLGVAPHDQEVFASLKLIFPVLGGWVPSFSAPVEPADESLSVIPLDDFKEARYDLAQSVLLLNASREFPDEVLVDAALYGVPCVGAGASEVQRTLWPELVAENPLHATELARGLLTNAARLRRIAAWAKAACREVYSPSEQDAAAWLRQLHAAQSSPVLASTR